MEKGELMNSDINEHSSAKPGEVQCDGCSKYYPQAMMNSHDVGSMHPGMGSIFFVTFCPGCMVRNGLEIPTKE
jgi:Pyruvate/2-oxoacid:ferredoxin oxidoreductase delta subunit